MSSIVATNAVVLRSIRFQESSRIVTFYTERFGRLSGIVKGARRSPARYGPSLQPMALVSLVVYRKPGREVQTVSQCDLVRSYRRIPADLDRMAVGMQMVELVGMTARHEEENPELYALLSGSLLELDGDPDPGRELLYRFELSLASILGFRADFDACAGCRRPWDASWPPGSGAVRIDIERGGALCPRCDTPATRGITLPAADLRRLRALSAGPAPIPGGGDGAGRNVRIEAFLLEYFSYHLPGFRRPRSVEVFERVNAPPPGKTPDSGNF